jgi:hypothetical protein
MAFRASSEYDTLRLIENRGLIERYPGLVNNIAVNQAAERTPVIPASQTVRNLFADYLRAKQS